jgi:glycosyltransferase involved in cell wall biosynthesis
LKLLIFAKQYLPEISAQSVRISQMARRLRQKDSDIQVRVVAFDPEGKDLGTKEGFETRIEVRRYHHKLLPPSALKPQSLNPVLLAIWLRIARREIESFKPDLVLATTPPFAPVTALYLASRMGGHKFPYIVDYRDDLTSVINSMAEEKGFYIKYPLKGANRLMSSLLFRALRGASMVSTVNSSLQKELQKINPKVLLVPNGLDLKEMEVVAKSFDRAAALKKSGIRDSRVMVYLGDLDMPYYVPEAVLEPMKHLRDEGYDLTYAVIGDGRHREVLEKRSKALGIQDQVYLLGRKSHREAMELLMASDLAFHTLKQGDPQARHAIATKVYEYLGCRLPILALADKESAVAKLVDDNGAGVSITWERMDDLEQGLKEILDHSEVYKGNLQSAYARLADQFDRNKGIDLLYENLVTLGHENYKN